MTTHIQRHARHADDGLDTATASVAIVIPAYNEQLNLPNLFAELEAATLDGPHNYRIVLVDDGSKDATLELATRYEGPLSLDVVSHPVNRGLGAALMTGFHRALEDPDVEVVVTIEADTTTDLSILEGMIGVVTGGVALAQGSMHHPDGVMVDVSGFRQLTSRAASVVMRIATGSRLHTFTNLYRAISADALRRSLVKRGDGLITERTSFAGVTELLLNLMRDGADVVEVPITLDAAKRTDDSKMPVWPTVRAQMRVAGKAFVRRLLHR
jgi:dolichol-phosphate mannosyltransferase